jgi:hypothetical protein
VVPQRLVIVGGELNFARPKTLLLRVGWEKYIESFDRAGFDVPITALGPGSDQRKMAACVANDLLFEHGNCAVLPTSYR